MLGEAFAAQALASITASIATTQAVNLLTTASP
jgi:hypothetical protein